MYSCFATMLDKLIRITANHIEVISKRDRLEQRRNSLKRELESTEKNLQTLNVIIKKNDSLKQSWIVQVPIKVFQGTEDKTKALNWKKVVIELITRYDIPMNAELLYHKILMNYDELVPERRFVIKNISSALSSLEMTDKKLKRCKDANTRGYIYGLPSFFDSTGNLRSKYLNRYKHEHGEEMLIDLGENLKVEQYYKYR
jgi:hypothetical protein